MHILFLNLTKKKRNVNVRIINVSGEHRKLFSICIFLSNFLCNNCIFYAVKSEVFWQFAMRGSWRCQTNYLFNDTDGNGPSVIFCGM